MKKFTDGEWQVIKAKDKFGSLTAEYAIVSEKRCIAHVWRDVLPSERKQISEEASANAQLIAAAPEMYKLLVSISQIEYLQRYIPMRKNSEGRWLQTQSNLIQDIKTIIARINEEEIE